MTLSIVIIVLLTLLLCGVPAAFAFAIAATAGSALILDTPGAALWLLGATIYDGAREYHLLVLPLFTAMGMLMARCGAAADVFACADRVLRLMPARLALATIAGNALFAAVTGVGAASAAAFSTVAYPQMQAARYRPAFAAGVIAGSSVLGLLIPPSVIMIVWAILTEQSLGRLLLASVGPALVLLGFYVTYVIVAFPRLHPDELASSVAAADDVNANAGVPGRRQLLTLVAVLLLIAAVLGGIWSGSLTAVEASAVGMFGAIAIAGFRAMRAIDIAITLSDAVLTVTPILVLMLGAQLFSRFLALNGIGEAITAWSEQGMTSDVALIGGMVLVWLALGAIVDSISIMLLTVPLFWPLASAMGIPPLAFAMIGILVIEAGVLTPPFGMAAFVVKGSIEDPALRTRDVFSGAAPYALMMLLCAALLYFLPGIAEWLPSLLLG